MCSTVNSSVLEEWSQGRLYHAFVVTSFSRKDPWHYVLCAALLGRGRRRVQYQCGGCWWIWAQDAACGDALQGVHECACAHSCAHVVMLHLHAQRTHGLCAGELAVKSQKRRCCPRCARALQNPFPYHASVSIIVLSPWCCTAPDNRPGTAVPYSPEQTTCCSRMACPRESDTGADMCIRSMHGKGGGGLHKAQG